MELNQFLLLSNSKFRGQITADLSTLSSLRQLDENPFYYNNKKLNEIKNILKNKNELEEYHNLIDKNKIKLFKEPIQNIFRKPPYLYGLGNGNVDGTKVSIIGSRDCTAYGKKIAYQLAYELSSYVQIVSGLAYGIDYMAHKGAVDAKNSTIAVLGSGILNCYPDKHKSLYRSVQENGLVLSEYGFFSKPLKHHFPFRNRLISGFSEVLIVVEAKENSGTMITVEYGLDQGKTILAVPGSVFSDYSEGTHKLIKQGAKVCTKIDDVLEEIIKFE